MSAAMAATILAPLGGAALAFVAPRRSASWLALAAALATVGSALHVAFGVATDGVVRHRIGGWGAPVGIELRADGIAAALLAVFSLVGAAVTIHARAHLGRDQRAFFPLWLFGWAALDALVLSKDLFNLYVCLELATIAAVGLVALGGGRDAFAAALRYLLVAMAGSLAYLLGVTLLYGAYATLDVELLSGVVAADRLGGTALAAMTAGLLAKTALFPLHGWLAPAHASAPSPASAVLSALVVKAGFVVAVRLWTEVFPPEMLARGGPALAALGAGAVLWGSLLAWHQRRLKLLVAYSTVAQLGYLFLLFGVGTAQATAAAVYLALAHAAAKGAFFLAAGTVQHAVGHDDIDRLDGVARRLPITFAAIGIAAASLIGLPPTGGFVGKWLLLRAAVDRASWGWSIVLLGGGLLTAAYCARVLRRAFLPPLPGADPKPAPLPEELATLALAFVALLLGLAPTAPIRLLGAGP